VTVFDYIVLTILAASILLSVLRGFVKEILSLLAWVAAFVVARTWGGEMAAMFPPGFSEALPGEMPRQVAGFAVLFLGTLLIVGLINLAIGQMLRAVGLTLADRGLGGLFGLARGVMIVLVLVIFAGLTELPRQPFWRDALLSPLAETGVRTLKPILPAAWAPYVRF